MLFKRKSVINNSTILILINNNFTALSMLAYYLENKHKYQKVKILLLIDETHKKNFLRRYDIDILKKILKIIDPKLRNYFSVEVPDTKTFNIKSSIYFIKKLFYFRSKNKKFKIKLSKILNQDYNEIWTGNSELINFIDVNCKVFKFEHGISEIARYCRENNNKFKFFLDVKRLLENTISKKIYFKHNYFFEFKLVSLFQNLIKTNFKNILKLKKESYFKAIKKIDLKLPKIKKNNNLILINYPLADFSNKKLINKFNNEFSQFIIKNIKHYNLKRVQIILKKKPSHKKNNTFDFLYKIKKLNKNNEVILFEKIQDNELNIDFYIEKLSPKYLFSNINSSSILFETIFPKRKFISTDKFVLKFINRNLNLLENNKFNEFARYKEYKNNLSFFT